MQRARWHLVNMLCGVVIAVLLGIHMGIQHLDDILCFFGVNDGNPTGWLSMITRSGRGTWAALYIALLAFVLYHALYGLRGIILEVAGSSRAERVINAVIIVVGIVVFGWGAYVPLALLQ